MERVVTIGTANKAKVVLRVESHWQLMLRVANLLGTDAVAVMEQGAAGHQAGGAGSSRLPDTCGSPSHLHLCPDDAAVLLVCAMLRCGRLPVCPAGTWVMLMVGWISRAS